LKNNIINEMVFTRVSMSKFNSLELPDRHCEQTSIEYIIENMNGSNSRMIKLHGTKRVQRGNPGGCAAMKMNFIYSETNKVRWY
jgi:hypothetical protein